jgi:hypothetical protein
LIHSPADDASKDLSRDGDPQVFEKLLKEDCCLDDGSHLRMFYSKAKSSTKAFAPFVH